MTYKGHLFIVFVWIFVLVRVYGQGYDGCPMYGCRPSGSFSESIDIPMRNASIGWVNEYFLGPIPNAGGCVGNSVNLVCQSNGPGPGDTGLKSYDLSTGAVKWRDYILRFPSLPVMDVRGTVWGSDGSNLVSYTADGKLIQQIGLKPQMRPLFSLQIVGEDFILLVSESGELSTLNTDGVPMASLKLRGSVERDNGTFLPTAPPVVNGNRFYVITEFVPDQPKSSTGILGLQRLYAIDTFHSMSDRMEVAWYANFERENDVLKFQRSFKVTDLKSEIIRKLNDPTEIKPSLLWDKMSEIVFISLPPPELFSRSRAESRFLGVKDTGNDSVLVFQNYLDIVNLVLFEVNLSPVNANPQLWGSLPDGRLVAFTKGGKVDRRFDLSGVFKTNFTITTKISVTRARNYDEDYLIFGIHVDKPTLEFRELTRGFGLDPNDNKTTSYVVAVDTPENRRFQGDIGLFGTFPGDPGMLVMWMVPCPEGSIPYGQIVGIPAANGRTKDQLVVFSQVEGKFGKVFTITSK